MQTDYPLINGAAEGRPQRKMTGRRSKATDAVILIVLPWLMFFLIACLFLFAYKVRTLVWILVGICAALALLFVVIGAAARHQIFLALGFLCLAAITVSISVGLYVDDEYLAYHTKIDSGTEYKDVDPKADAGQLTDAGEVHFRNTTFVDNYRTLGFVEAGEMYCVAPIVLPPKYSSNVQFWASGHNCCDMRMNFDCRDAMDPTEGKMKGVVQKDLNGFTKAIDEAKSVYKLFKQLRKA